MEEFSDRQFAQMRFSIADFRLQRIGLNALISKLEGLAQAVGHSFWEEDVFPTVLELEQINADLIEDRRQATPAENQQVELALSRLEERLNT